MAKSVRERMIWSTVELLRERGYTGTGFRDVVAHSEAPRGSIYHHFPGGKVQLAEEALEAGGKAFDGFLKDEIAKHGPVKGMARFLDLWGEFLERNEFRVGCPIVAVAVEEHHASPSLAEAADRQFARWEKTISEALVDTGIDRRRSKRLASTLVATLEGATILCRARRSRQPLRDTGREMEELVRSALPA
jgi:AcrR family transcriptional regulator